MELTTLLAVTGIVISLITGIIAFGQAFYGRAQARANLQQVQIQERALRLQEQAEWREEIDRRYSYEIAMLKHESQTYREAAEQARHSLTGTQNELAETRRMLYATKEELEKTRRDLLQTQDTLSSLRRQYQDLTDNPARRAV